ncbi:MAG: hypothetical protein ACYCYO_20745 [Bacilli bacterium]
METRKQVFEEMNLLRVPIEEEGVVFLNFPADECDGNIGYDGGMLEVAQQIAECIPKNIRRAVIVDFDKIPSWEMREKIIEKSYGGPVPEEHLRPSKAERELMELLGWWSDSEPETFHPEEEESVTDSM